MIVIILCFLILFSCITDVVSNAPITKRVLVIGGTGRVGRNVVGSLVSQGINTVCLIRDLDKAKRLEQLHGAQFVQGDVTRVEDLLSASKDCDMVIDVHGAKPLRFSKLTDLFTHPSNDISHPYNINYVGIKKLIIAMRMNKVKKLIRLTGGLVNKSPFHPFVLLFNLLLSMTVKWHERAEFAIRESGLKYTIIRAPELVNEPSTISNHNKTLILFSCDEMKTVRAGSIPIVDVAKLCVEATNSLDQCTVYVASIPNNNKKEPVDLKKLIPTITSDTKKLIIRRHSFAALSFLSIMTFLIYQLGRKMISVLGIC